MSTAPNGQLHTGSTVEAEVQRFWATQDETFMPFVTFQFIYERYCAWARTPAAGGVPVRQSGVFGRALSDLLAESNEWARVFVSRGAAVDGESMTVPSTVRSKRGTGDIVAYTRTSGRDVSVPPAGDSQ